VLFTGPTKRSDTEHHPEDDVHHPHMLLHCNGTVFPENGFLSPDKLSLLEKLLPERKEVEETDEMDQVELVDFDPNQERRCHYNGEAYEDDEHHPRGGVQCQTS